MIQKRWIPHLKRFLLLGFEDHPLVQRGKKRRQNTLSAGQETAEKNQTI